MNIFNKIKGSLFEPSNFFGQIKEEKRIIPTFIYYLVLFVGMSVLGFLLTKLIYSAAPTIMNSITINYGVLLRSLDYSNWLPTIFSPLFPLHFVRILNIQNFLIYPAVYLIDLIRVLLLSFICAGILCLWNKTFGINSKYTESYNLFVYSVTPTILFSWMFFIPFINIFAFIYSLILLIIGTQKMYDTKRLKTILMCLTLVVALILLNWAIFITIFATSFHM